MPERTAKHANSATAQSVRKSHPVSAQGKTSGCGERTEITVVFPLIKGIIPIDRLVRCGVAAGARAYRRVFHRKRTLDSGRSRSTRPAKSICQVIVLIAILHSLDALFINGAAFKPFRLPRNLAQSEKRRAKNACDNANRDPLRSAREVKRHGPNARAAPEDAIKGEGSEHNRNPSARHLKGEGVVGAPPEK